MDQVDSNNVFVFTTPRRKSSFPSRNACASLITICTFNRLKKEKLQREISIMTTSRNFVPVFLLKGGANFKR